MTGGFFDGNGFQPMGPSNTDRTAVTVTNVVGAKAIPGIPPAGSTGGGLPAIKLRAVTALGTNTAGAQRVYIEFGTASTVTAAAATSMPILVPSRELLRIPAGMSFYNVVTDAGACDLHLTPGNGD